MKSVKRIAHLLFYASRAVSLLLLAVGLYTAAVLFLSYQGLQGLPIHKEGNGTFVIFYPFTQQPFVLGDYNADYLVVMISVVFLYALFLWLLGGVFNAFRQTRLFTPRGISRLSRFSTANMTLPLLFLLLLFLFGQDLRDAVIIGFLHLMIGLFAFFMAAIFRQGVVLQEEQDLTL